MSVFHVVTSNEALKYPEECYNLSLLPDPRTSEQLVDRHAEARSSQYMERPPPSTREKREKGKPV